MEQNYAEAMRGRWRALWICVAVGAAVAWWIYRYSPNGQLTLATGLVGWGAVIGVTVVAYRIMKCPACGARLGSLKDKVCRSCGAMLTDEPIKPRCETGPSPETRAYMQRSAEILVNWSKFRVKLRWSPAIVGALSWIGFAVSYSLWSVTKSLSEGVFIGLMIGFCLAMMWWLMLVHVVDAFFGIVFSVWRGRCPLCRAWFTQSPVVVPGAIVSSVSLPDFCASCGEKLR